MYSRVVNAAVINTGTAFYSQPVSMQGANAIGIDAMTFYMASTSGVLSVDLEGSNDLENWEAITTGCRVTGIGYDADNYGDAGTERIAFSYVRIKATIDATGDHASFTAGLNPYSA